MRSKCAWIVDAMVHVVHVVRTLGRGGMERNLRRVVLATIERGIAHSILLLHDHPDVIDFPRSVPVIRLVSKPRDPRLAVRIAWMLRRLSPTVIHARNWGSWPDTAVGRLMSSPGVPLVFSYHGMDQSTVSLAL